MSNIEIDQMSEHHSDISVDSLNLDVKDSWLRQNIENPSSFNTSDKQNTENENLGLTIAVKKSEFKTIMSAIQSTTSRTAAAKKLGISPRTLRYKIAQIKNMV